MTIRAQPFRGLPFPVLLVVLLLAVGVPLAEYGSYSMFRWQLGGSPAETLRERFVLVILIGRSIGAVGLAVALLLWRNNIVLAVTIAAVWLAGPPITFLNMGITVLAASAGQFSWVGDPLSWIVEASLLPLLITISLLAPPSARRAFSTI